MSRESGLPGTFVKTSRIHETSKVPSWRTLVIQLSAEDKDGRRKGSKRSVRGQLERVRKKIDDLQSRPAFRDS